MNYWELLRLAAPETLLVLTVLAVLAVDLLALPEVEPRVRRTIGTLMAGLGCVLAAAWIVVMPEAGNVSTGMLVVDPLTRLLKVALLVLTLLTLAISGESDFTPHFGEYLALVLLATIGMMFLVSAEDILMIFIALEMTSLCLYLLTAFDQRQPRSAEAALKYFLFGGVSAAVTLFGFSLLYGLAGATNLEQIAAAMATARLDPLLLLAIVMTLAGFAFKVAAAPFHLWAPDVYQGAPTPSAALIASGSKVAGFFILARVMSLGFKGAEGSGGWQAYQPGWIPVLAVIAAVSMVLGNLAALAQTSVRRLLAYSAVAHAGYMLLAVVMAQHREGVVSLVYYATTYALTTLGAFGVVAVVQAQTGGDRLTDFAGLNRRAPLLSLCMLVFMLSLAGIPPLAGFFGKFYVFSAALRGGNLGLLWLVALAVAMSAVSLYYYLQVLKQVFVVEGHEPAGNGRTPVFGQIVLAIIAGAVVVVGCAPDWLLAPLTNAARSVGLQ